MAPHRAILAILCFLAAAACGRGSTDSPPDPASFVHELACVEPPQFGWEGQTLPVKVRATDAAGAEDTLFARVPDTTMLA